MLMIPKTMEDVVEAAIQDMNRRGANLEHYNFGGAGDLRPSWSF